ncbi:hypothetical protein QWI16_13770 [Gilvimarinus sp. SDUM040014]|uniref:Glycosyltransferase RgtA/B/C/D-like domain-containing protein n=1 Tax=Gilvimarinus algae TaxID=3058037 RepID=A0ABT8TID1_9GAMM|nr:hypothetical protein [Gilvimarinus sp. SDUM040014]
MYPWDAWQTWLYTAKAWYFNGSPIDMLPPNQWATLPNDGIYTVQGDHYPWLPPAQSWWLASILGAWQESRVLWPALAAALALGLALWGQVVAVTRLRLAGPLAAFLLLSLPLLNTHTAIAGYADLWLMGFSGLGLVALARGLLQSHQGQLWGGVVMLALGLLVKHDAIIWLICGVLLVGLLRIQGTKTKILTLCGAVIVGLLSLSLSPIDLKLNGEFASYGEILWLLESWHLLWYLLPGVLLLTFLSGSNARKTAKILGLIITVLLSSQILLFGATSAGSWIITAASRLLLQVSPLFIFALVCLAASIVGQEKTRLGWRCPAAVVAGSLCLLLALGGWMLSSANITTGPAPTLEFKAQQLRVVYGPMRSAGSQLRLPPATEGRAIVSTGPVDFDAAKFDILTLDIEVEGKEQSAQTFFWRTAANPSKPFVQDFSINSGQIVLSELSDWQGKIVEAGLILYPAANHTVTLHELTFEASTPMTLLYLSASDWVTPNFWTQASAHRTQLSSKQSLPALPLLVGLWVLLCWAALRLFTGATPLRSMLGVAMFAWLVLDARWIHNSYHQARATQAHYTNTAEPDALDIGDDVALFEMARQIRETLGQEPRHILIVTPKRDDYDRFASRRIKYTLLPHAVHIQKGQVSTHQIKSMDAAIWLSGKETSIHNRCPPPLERTKPSVLSSRGILCTVQH